MTKITGHLSVLGPFEWTEPASDPGSFIDRMRSIMVNELARLRGDEAARERALRNAHRLYTEMGATGHAERLAKELDL